MLLRINDLLSDPRGFLISLLLMLPGACLAISIHESAHGWVAERCGDPTARYAGRITLNPAKHFDPIGFLCILFVGFGWAKPVPVNPLLFKNYRKDDIKVALAGITANICLCLVCFILLEIIFMGSLASTPVMDYRSAMSSNETMFRVQEYDGSTLLVTTEGQMTYVWQTRELFQASSGLYYYNLGGSTVNAADIIVTPALGRVMGIIYQMLVNCMLFNMTLAVFNLIPIPPLDGYHVLNDLVLKQDLFAQQRTQRICMLVLLTLIMIGNINPKWDVISIVIGGAARGVSAGLTALARLVAVGIGVM